MKRTTAFLAVVLVLGVAVPLPAAAAAAPPPRLRWQACHSDVAPNLECATFRVPLDHDRPRGQKISLALIRIPAGDPERRIGSLFLNPGGPGTSGVDMVLRAAGSDDPPYSAEVLARFDLVGFDPRGIHRSTPLLCFRSLEQALGIVPPVPFPVSPDEEAMFERADRALNRACQRRGGPIVDHMATGNVARDLDLLRQAVGDRQLTYAGYSYGTFLGITYANLYPRRVRALVLDSVVDPIAWTTGRGDEAETEPVYNRLGNPAGAQATLEEFFRLCDAAGPEGCAFAGNSAARFAALAEQLRSEPLEYVDPETGETVVFTYAHLIKTTWDAMNTASDWPDLAEFLAELEGRAQLASDRPRRSMPSRRAPGGAGQRRRIPTSWRAITACSAPTATTPTTTATGRRPAPRLTTASATSAGCGPGSPARARCGRASTPTATPVPSTAPPPTRYCWWGSASIRHRPM